MRPIKNVMNRVGLVNLINGELHSQPPPDVTGHRQLLHFTLQPDQIKLEKCRNKTDAHTTTVLGQR